MKKDSLHKNKFIIITIIVVIIVIVTFCISQTKGFKYFLANNFLNNGKYEKALNIFSKLDNYKDSESKKKEARIGYGKEHTGTLSGLISWKYNNFVRK